MRTPAFWYRPAGLISFLLLPLAAMFWTAGFLRRLRATPYHSKIPVICVGNIVAGGAGKTPTAIALCDMLQQTGANPVFVTRGYGGTEKGPLQVDPARHTAADVGDEALLLARQAQVWIGRDRVAAIQAAENQATHIILDDGLQNPAIKPAKALLVIDGKTGIGNGRIIPAGPLRETLSEAIQHIDAIIIIGEDQTNLSARLEHPVLYADIKSSLEALSKETKYFAFAGIGRPEKFYQTCRDAGLVLVGTHNFADHHLFSPGELVQLEKTAAEAGAKLLTTEKDWVRLSPEWKKKVSTLPIKLIFYNPEAVGSILYLSSITA